MNVIRSLAVLLWISHVCCAAGVKFDIGNKQAHISAHIVDENGVPLNDVQLQVVAEEMVELDTVRRETNMQVNSQFTLEMSHVFGIGLVARKDGYAPCFAHLKNKELYADDLVLTLRLAPPITQLIQVDQGEFTLDATGDGWGILLDTARIIPISAGPDLYFRFPDDWDVSSGDRLSSIVLSMAGDGGFAAFATNDDRYVTYALQSGVEAPADGYLKEIKLPLSGDIQRLFFFKSPKGFYGKMQIQSLYFSLTRGAVAEIRYFYQPDGSRNLNNGERLKLIRAKRAK